MGGEHRGGGEGPAPQSSASRRRPRSGAAHLAGAWSRSGRAPRAAGPAPRAARPPGAPRARPRRTARRTRRGAPSCPRRPCARGTGARARARAPRRRRPAPPSAATERRGAAGAAWGPPPDACSAPAGPSWHSRARSLRAPGRRPGNGGLAGRPGRRSLSGGRAEGGPFPPRGPGGGESSKAGRRLLALAVRPGGGAGLARPPPLPPLRLSRRPRNAGGRGRGHPVSGRGPAPAAPQRRTRAPGRPARTRGLPAREGEDLAAALRPPPCSGPLWGSAGAWALTTFRERPPLPLGVVGKKEGPFRAGGLRRSFGPDSGCAWSPAKRAWPRRLVAGVGWAGEEALGNDRGGRCARALQPRWPRRWKTSG